MPKNVRIPTPLRKFTNDVEVVEVTAATVGEAIIELQTKFPGIKERLMDDNGEVRRFVNIYVNEEDIRFLQNQQPPLKSSHKCPVVTNITQASVTDEIGIVSLELDGKRSDIKAAIKWLEKIGVSVEPVEINVIES